jgi:hypothetical protein
MSLTRSLSITIPKEELTIEELIQRLRYLETPKCRSEHTEEWRLEEIKETTKRFRKALQVKEFFDAVEKTESILMYE